MKIFVSLVAGLALSLGSAGVLADAAPAADVNLVTGTATAESAGVERELHKGATVFAGDTLTVGANSYLNLLFKDGGRVLLRPGTQFTVDSYEYNGPPPVPETQKPAEAATTPAPAAAPPPPAQALPVTGRAFFKLVRGGFRAISGLLGKANPADYKVATPIATIGIRGTDYDLVVCNAGECPTELLPPGTPADSGLVMGVNEGGISVTTSQGTFNVDLNQFGLALANGQFFVLPFQPMTLMVNPTPDPRSCQ